VGAQLSAAQAQAAGLHPAALGGRMPPPRAAEGSGEGSGDESSGQGSHDADAARPAPQEPADARAGGLPARPVRATQCSAAARHGAQQPRRAGLLLRRPRDISAPVFLA
jgi:hypothetical protein